MVDRLMAPEAVEIGRVVRTAVQDAGGFDLVMRSEAEPAERTAVIEPLLASLGVFELRPADSQLELEAAASVCRAAGAFALPYPVAERLSCPAELDATALSMAFGRNRINMGDLPLRWATVDRGGAVSAVTRVGPRLGTKLAAFVTECVLAEPRSGPPDLLPTALNLATFTLLGMLDSAFAVTLAHVRDRVQFGSPLVSFQAVQYQLVDAQVAIQMLEEQAHYAVWSQARRRDNRLVDAVAARAAALRAADVTFRVGHQLHGASGFCDESPISWLSRHSQPLRQLPLNGPGTDAWLADLMVRNGFDGLFPSTVAAINDGVVAGNGRLPAAASFVPAEGVR